jgi:hypothetical protein
MTTATGRRKFVRHRKPPAGEHALWADPAEAADALGVSERTIRRRCLAGDLECVDMGGGWMVSRDELPPTVSVEVPAGMAARGERAGLGQGSGKGRGAQPLVLADLGLTKDRAGDTVRAWVGPLRRLPGPAVPDVRNEAEEPEPPAIF